MPTTVPPPGTGLAGAIGQRCVISFVGLPARGKPFMCQRLCRYLSFFHGAKCKIFDIADDELADDAVLTQSLKTFLEEEDEEATTQLMLSLDGIEQEPDTVDREKRNVDVGRIAILFSHDELATHEKK